MARLFIIAAIVFITSIAHAQVMTTAESTSNGPGDLTIAAFDPTDAVGPVSVVEGPGLKIGEGTTLHPVVGLETGYVSNVFYSNTNAQAAGVLRVIAQIGTSSLDAARLTSNVTPGVDSDDSVKNYGSFEYQGSVRLSYDQMLSDDSVIQDTGGLGIGAFFQGLTNPQGAVAFGVDESFTRTIRAANYETSNDDNRDLNDLRLSVLFQPPGRSLSGFVYYKNHIDIFENDGNLYPSRDQNTIGVHPMWHWLPKTLVFGDISESYVTGLGSGMASQEKVTSYPFQAVVGITTLLSLKTTFIVEAGYTNGFYSNGPSFSAPLINTLFTYRYSPKGRLGVSYDLIYADSVNANYYRDHIIRAYAYQAIDPIVLMVQPEIHFREYDGVTVPGNSTNRDDTIVVIRGGIHYDYKKWLAFVLDYKFSSVQTDFRYMVGTGLVADPSYARHELMLGVRAAL